MSDKHLAALMYSEETVGKLIRRLNLMCRDAMIAKDFDNAQTAAGFSNQVEKAMEFAGLAEKEEGK